MIKGGATMEKIVRKNIRMSPEIGKWYEDRAESLGVSQSNLMVMALAEYIKQDKTIDAMTNLKGMLEELTQLSEDNKGVV